MALMSWKHIETQSLFCTGLHESKWWKHQVLGNLVNESVKLSHIQVWRKTPAPRSRCLPQSACVWNLPKTSLIAKSSGKFESKKFHHGVWILNQKLFPRGFFSKLQPNSNSPAGGLVGAVSLTAVSWGLNTVPVYWHRLCRKKFQTPTSSSKQMSLIEFVENQLRVSCYWLHSIEISIWLTTFVRINLWPLPRFHWRRWRLCWARTLGLPSRWLLRWLSRAVPLGEDVLGPWNAVSLYSQVIIPFTPTSKHFFQNGWHKKDEGHTSQCSKKKHTQNTQNTQTTVRLPVFQKKRCFFEKAGGMVFACWAIYLGQCGKMQRKHEQTSTLKSPFNLLCLVLGRTWQIHAV